MQLKQNQGGFEEELLFARKSIRDVLCEEEAGGRDSDEGSKKEMPDCLLTGWHDNTCHTPSYTCLHLIMSQLYGYSNAIIVKVFWSNYMGISSYELLCNVSQVWIVMLLSCALQILMCVVKQA